MRSQYGRVGPVLLVIGAAVFSLGLAGGGLDAAPVSFNDWTVEGASDAGSWEVTDGGATVTQTVNGAPTFFVSPTDLTQDTFTGSITPLAAGGDGDYFGVVLGYTDPLGANSDACDPDGAKCPNDYVLFDWKHDDQGDAKAGYSLVRVNGDFVVNDANADLPCFWNHSDDPANGCDVLASNFSPDAGWNFDEVYELRFTYTSSVVRVERVVGGNPTTLLEATGSFPMGRVGFYNYSQAQVRYTGFDASQATTTTTDPSASTTTTTAVATTSSTVPASTSTTSPTSTTTTTTHATATTTQLPATTTTTRVGVLSRTGTTGLPIQLVLGAVLVCLGALLIGLRGSASDGVHFR